MLGANASMCCIINQINNNAEPSNLLSLAITEERNINKAY